MDEPLSREQLIQRELMEGDTSNADIYPCDCGGCYKCNPCDPDYGNDRANEEEWEGQSRHPAAYWLPCGSTSGRDVGRRASGARARRSTPDRSRR